jgi:glycosyltransferase involved in cell wall biosynthesis
MLAHHFPPSGGSGSNRASAFARYLPDYGWHPTVISPAAAWAVNRDDALLALLPDDLRVVRTRSWEPRPRRAAAPAPTASTPLPSPHASPGARPPLTLRRHLGHLKRFPDAHLGWLPFALAAARRQPYDVAYSSSGPFTSHLIGLILKRLTGRPWVAELRDGWYRWNRAIFPDYPAWRNTLERRLEAATVRAADRVVCVTDRMAAAFQTQYACAGLPETHFSVVSNGFDPVQFGSSTPPERHAGWHVLHAGALYYGRSLTAFLQAALAVKAANGQFARDFRLTLMGTLDGSARREIDASGLGDSVHVLGQAPHATAIEAMRAADALLLVANTTPGAEATVPGKLFEYLAVGRPVLAIAPPASSTADVLQASGGGWLADAASTESIACVLRHGYAMRNARPQPAQVGVFDRHRLTGELARIFDEVLAGAARRS